jgi:hypothetical protein
LVIFESHFCRCHYLAGQEKSIGLRLCRKI